MLHPRALLLYSAFSTSNSKDIHGDIQADIKVDIEADIKADIEADIDVDRFPVLRVQVLWVTSSRAIKRIVLFFFRKLTVVL